MRYRLGTALCAAALLCAAPSDLRAATQEPSSADAQFSADMAELRQVFPGLIEQLNALAAANGIAELPPMDWDGFLTDFADAVPRLHEDDERDWGWSVHFEFRTTAISSGELEADPDIPAVVGEASGCLADGAVGEILHFRRIRNATVGGHHCVIGTTTAEGDWILNSVVVAEGHGRRLLSVYRAVAVVEGEAGQARALAEPRIEAQIAVAGTLAEYAMGLLDRPAATPAPSVS